MVFFNSVVFKETVVGYTIRFGYNLKQYKYDKSKIVYKCVGGKGCDWRVYCSRSSHSTDWIIRICKNVHLCSPNGEYEMIKVFVIARLFIDKIREEPEYHMPLKMEEMIFEKWKIKVSRCRCQAARIKALRWIEKEYEEQFACLRDYGAEILEAMPNSTVNVKKVGNENYQGVIHAVELEFPSIKHKMCVRHIYASLKETQGKSQI